MKYSILMPYYKRPVQLKNTLISFDNLYRDRNDYEIILIKDMKSSIQDKNDIESVLNNFGNLNIKVISGTTEESFSPATNFNIGANMAIGEFLIITNPEGMHSANILEGLDEEFEKSKNVYIVCSCLSLPVDKIKTLEGKWYQHSVHRNSGCHFCSAISKDQYFKIGGFSDEFSAGIGYDDDDFRNKIEQAKISFVYRDDLLTLHIDHDKDPLDMNKFLRNTNLFNEKWGVNSFRAGQLPVI